jgi:hypothetical protein
MYLHAAFVMFVVLGQLLIIVGGVLRWRWVRDMRFRVFHLAAIAVVVIQSWFGVICPLTDLEVNLRVRAGDTVYPGSFIAHWVDRLLYYEAPGWVFGLIYTAFGLLVLASWRWFRPYPRQAS